RGDVGPTGLEERIVGAVAPGFGPNVDQLGDGTPARLGAVPEVTGRVHVGGSQASEYAAESVSTDHHGSPGSTRRRGGEAGPGIRPRSLNASSRSDRSDRRRGEARAGAALAGASVGRP